MARRPRDKRDKGGDGPELRLIRFPLLSGKKVGGRRLGGRERKGGYGLELGLNVFRFSAGRKRGSDESPVGRTPAKLGLIGFPLVSEEKEGRRRPAGRETREATGRSSG
jgi:hypothetical protein